MNTNSKYVGKKIEILSMDGEPRYSGRIGTVTSEDDIGQLHGTWGGLAVLPGVDSFRIIEDN